MYNTVGQHFPDTPHPAGTIKVLYSPMSKAIFLLPQHKPHSLLPLRSILLNE